MEAAMKWREAAPRLAARRNELVTRNLRLVHHVARQFSRATEAGVEMDDLVSAGSIGLIKAVENFDPSRGLAFSTFAAPRIRGAILDDLRARDHAPRSLRRKQRDLTEAAEALATRLGREPSDRELANELDIEVEKVWRWRREVECASQISLEEPRRQGRSGPRPAPAELVAASDGSEVEQRVQREQMARILAEEIFRLSEREQRVLTLYYFEGHKLDEIASMMGVTGSRISQIRSKALATLRDRFEARELTP